VVVRIDGIGATQHLEALQALLSGSTQWRRQRAAKLALAGPEGTDVQIEVRSPDDPGPRPLTLRRSRAGLGRSTSRPDTVRTLEGGTLYADLTRLETTRIAAVMAKAATASGLILDLRGSAANDAWRVLRHLTDKPIPGSPNQLPIRSRPEAFDDEVRDLTHTIKPAEPRVPVPVVFLVDGSTIGPAEAVAAAARFNALGRLCGSNTAGAFGDRNGLTLPGGAELIWTATRTTGPDGSDPFHVGLAPDIPAVPTVEALRTGRDAVLEAAVQAIAQVQRETTGGTPEVRSEK